MGERGWQVVNRLVEIISSEKMGEAWREVVWRLCQIWGNDVSERMGKIINKITPKYQMGESRWNFTEIAIICSNKVSK